MQRLRVSNGGAVLRHWAARSRVLLVLGPDDVPGQRCRNATNPSLAVWQGYGKVLSDRSVTSLRPHFRKQHNASRRSLSSPQRYRRILEQGATGISLHSPSLAGPKCGVSAQMPTRHWQFPASQSSRACPFQKAKRGLSFKSWMRLTGTLVRGPRCGRQPGITGIRRHTKSRSCGTGRGGRVGAGDGWLDLKQPHILASFSSVCLRTLVG